MQSLILKPAWASDEVRKYIDSPDYKRSLARTEVYDNYKLMNLVIH